MCTKPAVLFQEATADISTTISTFIINTAQQTSVGKVDHHSFM